MVSMCNSSQIYSTVVLASGIDVKGYEGIKPGLVCQNVTAMFAHIQAIISHIKDLRKCICKASISHYVHGSQRLRSEDTAPLDSRENAYHLSGRAKDVNSDPQLFSAVIWQLHGSCTSLVWLELEPLHEVCDCASLVQLVGVRHTQREQDFSIARRYLQSLVEGCNCL